LKNQRFSSIHRLKKSVPSIPRLKKNRIFHNFPLQNSVFPVNAPLKNTRPAALVLVACQRPRPPRWPFCGFANGSRSSVVAYIQYRLYGLYTYLYIYMIIGTYMDYV
jgi:hypothetical protein